MGSHHPLQFYWLLACRRSNDGRSWPVIRGVQQRWCSRVGFVFELTNSQGTWSLTDLHDFTGGSDGAPTLKVALCSIAAVISTVQPMLAATRVAFLPAAAPSGRLRRSREFNEKMQTLRMVDLHCFMLSERRLHPLPKEWLIICAKSPILQLTCWVGCQRRS